MSLKSYVAIFKVGSYDSNKLLIQTNYLKAEKLQTISDLAANHAGAVFSRPIFDPIFECERC